MAKLKSSARKKQGSASEEAGLQAKAEHLSRSIVDSAQQIWLAGVGAFARAQEEGTKLFEMLVKEGNQVEKSTRKLASRQVDAVRDAMEERVGQVRERATDTWDRLEKVFEQRVQRALNRLGVPSREEIQALIARVDALNAELRRISAGRPAGQPARAKAPAREPAAKKAARKTVRKPVRKAAKPAARKAAVPKVAKPIKPGEIG